MQVWLEEGSYHVCVHLRKLPPRADRPFTGKLRPPRALPPLSQQLRTSCTPSCSPAYTQYLYIPPTYLQ